MVGLKERKEEKGGNRVEEEREEDRKKVGDRCTQKGEGKEETRKEERAGGKIGYTPVD